MEENDNSWQLVVTKKIDYEALDVSDRTLTFDVYVDPNASGGYISVQLSINNIDDNPPYIEIITNPCQIDVSIGNNILIFKMDLKGTE